jgi:hypothetical protein
VAEACGNFLNEEIKPMLRSSTYKLGMNIFNKSSFTELLQQNLRSGGFIMDTLILSNARTLYSIIFEIIMPGETAP